MELTVGKCHKNQLNYRLNADILMTVHHFLIRPLIVQYVVFCHLTAPPLVHLSHRQSTSTMLAAMGTAVLRIQWPSTREARGCQGTSPASVSSYPWQESYLVDLTTILCGSGFANGAGNDDMRVLLNGVTTVARILFMSNTFNNGASRSSSALVSLNAGDELRVVDIVWARSYM